MPIISMQRISVIGLDTIKEQLISDFLDLGVVQLTEPDEMERSELEGYVENDGNDIRISSLEVQANRVANALEYLEKYSIEKGPLFSTRRIMNSVDFHNVLKDRVKINKNVDQILQLNDKIHKINEQINKMNSDLVSLEPWLIYDLPLEISSTEFTSINRGVVPSTVDIEKLYEIIIQKTEVVSIREIFRDKDLIYIVIISMKSEEENVLNSLKQYGYAQTSFSGFTGTTADNKRILTEELHRLEKSRKSAEDEIRALCGKKYEMECLFDQLIIERDHEKIKENILKTKRAFSLEGWVPTRCREAVTDVLKRNECWFLYRNPLENEDVPVLIENNSFVQPFEAITDMYALPDYRGVDPTRIFAFFYAMFFGIMLSDGGYGIIISISCFIIQRKYNLEGMTQKMVKMFFYCGLSTVFWGAMFGGWFGDFIPVVAEVFLEKDVIVKPLWFNPIENPTRLLIWSLVFGVVHLFLGMGLNAYMLIKEGHWIDAVFDVFSWYLVILGVAIYIVGGMASNSLIFPGMVMVIIGLAVLLLTGGRKKRGLGRITGGLSSLYSVTNYISDILSYSRLLALGLATGVIAQVVNTMGTLSGGGFFGAIVLTVVFLVGHTFNMAINALGAFVHSSRLQYIEFFGKFYKEGGEEFQPYRRNTKYVRLTNTKVGGKK